MKARMCLTVVGMAAVMVSMAVAQPAKETVKPSQPAHQPDKKPGQPATKPGEKPAHAPGQPGDHQLPPGMSEADMKAAMEAATPGPNHQWLAEAAGEWKGTCTMWMTPGSEPMKSEMTSSIKTVMDGKFTICETKGEMPGMGPFFGHGMYGYDNVSKEFQSTWIDSMGTGMMVGTGKLSADKKTLTWNYTFNCPIAKKAIKMREIESRPDSNTCKLEMHGEDPKTGKEFKMMEISMTRTGAAPTVSGSR
jgi:hypothetical protein